MQMETRKIINVMFSEGAGTVSKLSFELKEERKFE